MTSLARTGLKVRRYLGLPLVWSCLGMDVTVKILGMKVENYCSMLQIRNAISYQAPSIFTSGLQNHEGVFYVSCLMTSSTADTLLQLGQVEYVHCIYWLTSLDKIQNGFTFFLTAVFCRFWAISSISHSSISGSIIFPSSSRRCAFCLLSFLALKLQIESCCWRGMQDKNDSNACHHRGKQAAAEEVQCEGTTDRDSCACEERIAPTDGFVVISIRKIFRVICISMQSSWNLAASIMSRHI